MGRRGAVTRASVPAFGRARARFGRRRHALGADAAGKRGGVAAYRIRARRTKLRGVRKIILEILVLLWKALRVVLWKWLKPLIGTIALYAMVAVGVVVLLVMLVSRL